jgi:PBSX family phage terminase large subunit
MTSRSSSSRQPSLKLSEAAADQLLKEVIAEAKRQVGARTLHAAQPFEARGAALAVRSCHDREVLLCGPAGTGKSRGILEYLDDLCWEYPGIRILFVRKTRNSLTESALYTWEEFVVPAGSPILDGPQRLNRSGYHYPDGSEIILGGLDKPRKLFSTEFDIVYIQEATEVTINDWESLLRCLRHHKLPWQQLIADCNPSFPTHWLKQRCDAGTTTLLPSRHEDNPTLFDAATGQWTKEGQDYLAILDAMTGARKAWLRLGLWSQAEGCVWDMFDAGVHIIDRREIPRTWRRIRVVDFGYTNPFVCQWWAIDPDGRMYLYREIYRTQSLVEDLATEIKDLSFGETIEATICDHDAEDAATLRRHGIPTKPAAKAVSTGLQAVAARLRKAGDGRPRLFILRDSLVERDKALAEKMLPTCTADEIPGYVWQQDASGKANKEEPLKVNDHGCDGTRYAVTYVDPIKSKKTRVGAAAGLYGS